jgi:hypothetical protein
VEHREALLALFNKALDKGDMPTAWKNVIIVAVYKRKGPVNDCNNHRGISLISHNSKLLERMLLERLEPGLEEYVPINQYGFKKKCGTADAILISKLLGNSAYNQRMADIRCYVDFTQSLRQSQSRASLENTSPPGHPRPFGQPHHQLPQWCFRTSTG